MKNEFSTKWVSSVQKRKQHKYIFNAPLHKKHKFLSTNLNKELRKKYGKRNLPLRVGDEVLVMRGASKKKKAKVTSIDLKKTKVYLENIQKTKKDGTKVAVPFHPSVLQIQTLNLDDKLRMPSKEQKKAEKKEEKIEPKSKEVKSQKTKENKNA